MGTAHSSFNKNVDLPIPDILNSDSDNYDNYYKNNNVNSSSNDTFSDTEDQYQSEYDISYKYISTFIDKWYMNNKNIDTTLLQLPNSIAYDIRPDIEKAIYKKTIFILYSLVSKLFVDIKYNIYGYFFNNSNKNPSRFKKNNIKNNIKKNKVVNSKDMNIDDCDGFMDRKYVSEDIGKRPIGIKNALRNRKCMSADMAQEKEAIFSYTSSEDMEDIKDT